MKDRSEFKKQADGLLDKLITLMREYPPDVAVLAMTYLIPNIAAMAIASEERSDFIDQLFADVMKIMAKQGDRLAAYDAEIAAERRVK